MERAQAMTDAPTKTEAHVRKANSKNKLQCSVYGNITCTGAPIEDYTSVVRETIDETLNEGGVLLS